MYIVKLLSIHIIALPKLATAYEYSERAINYPLISPSITIGTDILGDKPRTC